MISGAKPGGNLASGFNSLYVLSISPTTPPCLDLALVVVELGAFDEKENKYRGQAGSDTEIRTNP